jgi:D-alanine-D-alanine ligase
MPGEPRIRLVVLFGGQSAEHEVSCITAGHVLKAADPTRYDLLPVGITQTGDWVTADAALGALEQGAQAIPQALEAAGSRVDPLPILSTDVDHDEVVVFPVLHGPYGEDGTVQGLLELADVPYVGAGVLASALAMDKDKAKEVLAQHGLPQARWRALHQDQVSDPALGGTALDDAAAAVGGLPVFVKPANLGSSIGVSKARSADELRDAAQLALTYDEWIVLEETIVGREIEVAVLGNRSPRASVPGEVRSASDFYDYEDKYVDGRAELLIPAPLSTERSDEVRSLALDAYRALRVEGMARVDFFFEEGGRGFLVNEINTIPGFTPVSMYPKLWEATGLPYATLIDELVRLAIERHAARAARRTAARQPSLHRPSS